MAEANTSRQTPSENLNDQLIHNLSKPKFWCFVALAIIPEMFFWSFSLYIVKMRATDYVRCEVRPLENTSWTFQEIREISQTRSFHKECYIYKFDYTKIANMNFHEAKYFLSKKIKSTKKLMCKNFVTTENEKIRNLMLAKEFADFCQGVQYEIIYDSLASFFFILGSTIILPFADLYGRKRIIDFGVQVALGSAFMGIVMIGSGRSLMVTAFVNFAYPTLKYTTQSIIFEISEDRIRPLAFMLTYVGSSVCLLICALLPLMSWQVTKLILYSVCLLLPLIKWSMSESPLWLKSKNKKEATVIVETVNKPHEHADLLLSLHNEKVGFDTIKSHFQEFQNISPLEYVSLIAVSLNVGFICFYPLSKYKFMYHYFEQSWIRFFNYINGLYAALIAVCLTYLFGSKWSLIILSCINSFFYILLCNLKSDFPYEESIVLVVSGIEIFAGCTNILYQFYLSEIFPTSHRCSYIGIFNAIVNLGFLLISCIRFINVFVAEIITTLSALIGFPVIIMFLRPTHPMERLILNFDVENIQSPK